MRSVLVGWAFDPVRRSSYDPRWRKASVQGAEWTSKVASVPPCTGLILAWNAATPPGAGIACEISASIDGRWSAWTPMGEWGAVPPTTPPESPIRRDVDTASWKGTADAVRVRVRRMANQEGRLPRLKRIILACDAETGDEPHQSPPTPGPAIRAVPFRSQMGESPEIARRICGPASLAMHLAAREPLLRTEEVAAAVYDRAHDLYGNWAHLAAVAGEHGFVAWVERYARLADVEERLLAGYGAILSLSFEADELEGAPIPRTTGHLLVLRGWDEEGNPVCNDPAFPDNRGDGVVYRREQLERAWAAHGGATILLRPE